MLSKVLLYASSGTFKPYCYYIILRYLSEVLLEKCSLMMPHIWRNALKVIYPKTPQDIKLGLITILFVMFSILRFLGVDLSAIFCKRKKTVKALPNIYVLYCGILKIITLYLFLY